MVAKNQAVDKETVPHDKSKFWILPLRTNIPYIGMLHMAHSFLKQETSSQEFFSELITPQFSRSWPFGSPMLQDRYDSFDNDTELFTIEVHSPSDASSHHPFHAWKSFKILISVSRMLKIDSYFLSNFKPF